jgi:preprotein translocase subunit SecG
LSRLPFPHLIHDVFTFLLVLMVLDALLLIPIVLLQSGKGGGLAAMGGGAAGTDTLFGGRQAATLLTKGTWWAGGAFLVLGVALSLVSSRPERSESILRGGLEEAPVAPALPGAGTSAPAPVTPAPSIPQQ